MIHILLPVEENGVSIICPQSHLWP
ncbi:uncharacterized protein METZ01_LOCUS325467 [marine metagenome]|uniref:Uncharacterized protein n=1 Tax=marine metagenome TaxID=408172 RepID=A0A382PGV0_9ZZZZ